jgi:hypothetical protein
MCQVEDLTGQSWQTPSELLSLDYRKLLQNCRNRRIYRIIIVYVKYIILIKEY